MRAKIIDGVIVYAPKKIKHFVDGVEYAVINPTDEMLADAGWMIVHFTDPPNAPEGWHCEPTYTEWQTETGQEIWQEWMLVQDEITEESALVRYANEVTGVDNPDLMSAAETMLKRLTEV